MDRKNEITEGITNADKKNCPDNLFVRTIFCLDIFFVRTIFRAGQLFCPDKRAFTTK